MSVIGALDIGHLRPTKRYRLQLSCLWSPYGIEQTIIFLSWFFLLFSFLLA